MTNTILIEELRDTNPWWKGPFTPLFKPREILAMVAPFLPARQILAFTGLRRVGKTTLLYMILKAKLEEGFDPSRIVYFSFDNFRDVAIKEVVTTSAELTGHNLDEGPSLFLFDEIQKVERWEEQIKRLYDRYPLAKIILSGSESLFIRQKTRESLAGRFFEFFLTPLRFTEFLQFKGVSFSRPQLYFQELRQLFHEYLLCNGFPELIGANQLFVEKYLKENIVEKIIYRDLPQLVPVRDPAIVEQLFMIILLEPGQIIDTNDVASELGLARQTVALYLDYLEKSFLIRKLYNFSRNARKTQRKLKKYYPTIILPRLLEGDFGKVLETALVLQLQAEFFWRDAYKREVDVILTTPRLAPVEIKSGNKIDYQNVLYFMKKFNLTEGYVLTDNQQEEIQHEDKKIGLVPGFLYLLQK